MIGDVQRQVMAVVFPQDLIVAEDVNAQGRSFLQVHPSNLGWNGKRLLWVPESLALHIESKSRVGYISIEVTVWRVSEPPNNKILLWLIMTALLPCRSEGRSGRDTHFSSSKEYFSHYLMISPDQFLPPKTYTNLLFEQMAKLYFLLFIFPTSMALFVPAQ